MSSSYPTTHPDLFAQAQKLTVPLEDYGRPATIVACVSDPGDAEALRGVKLGERIELVVIQQSDLGKREAMERALSLLASRPVPPNSCVVLMDGDTVVQTGLSAR
jgi:hypothetical protein